MDKRLESTRVDCSACTVLEDKTFRLGTLLVISTPSNSHKLLKKKIMVFILDRERIEETQKSMVGKQYGQ